MKTHFLPIAGFCLALTGTGLAQKIIPNHAIANLVLGQTDFVSENDPGVESSISLDRPEGVVVDPVTGKIFVSDYDNVSAKPNGARADGVLCQPNFITNTVTLSARGSLCGPIITPFVDGAGALWIADTDHNRVLRFPPDTTLPLLTGTTSWEFKASLAKGANTITLFVTDTVGKVSSRTIKIKRVTPKSAPQLLVSEN